MTIFRANVHGGTGAGSKSRPDPTVPHCDCGRFIEQQRANHGATLCLSCVARDLVQARYVHPRNRTDVAA